MASKKRVPAAVTERVASTADHPEYLTELPEAVTQLETTSSEPANHREEQIRQAAYAAFESRGDRDGGPEQDWLEAEAKWERSRSR